ncbi:unnamed protein product [Ectocarpus sp. 8 AP-2014]
MSPSAFLAFAAILAKHVEGWLSKFYTPLSLHLMPRLENCSCGRKCFGLLKTKSNQGTRTNLFLVCPLPSRGRISGIPRRAQPAEPGGMVGKLPLAEQPAKRPPSGELTGRVFSA